MYPNDRLYSKEHEWVLLEGDTCTLGITEFAQKELGEIVFVELPEAGDEFEAHEEIGTVESVKAVAEVYTPVSGEIVEANETLEDRPELVNEDPHGEGWMVKLRIDRDSAELDELMDADAYEEFVGGEE
ncbi:MAG: glycine cleavage system protein GcvH [Thermoanaerobaculia bacterium]|nr:glycine cleavage system protein GcvH [Thermoanaerobaculia bacterium]